MPNIHQHIHQHKKIRPTSVLLLMVTLSTSGALAAGPEAVTFTAADGVTVHADHYPADKSAPLILLFHQASSNRGEYRDIAPRLQKLGFAGLALDQRSGANRWELTNQTVDALGKSASYLDALPDLEAALVWGRKAGYEGKILVWGSSYSAALVFLLTAEKSDDIAGVLSFSPGEYLGEKTMVQSNAAKVHVPVAIFAPNGEREQATTIFEALPDGDNHLHVPKKAVHGSSMLITARNNAAESIWKDVETFLATFKQ